MTLSRRDFLKRGAALGGAALWVTPMAHAVALEASVAEPVSPLCNVWYAVKIQRVDNTTVPECVDIFNQSTTNSGKCLDVDDLPEPPVSGGCAHIVDAQLAAEGATDKSWTITLDRDCRYLEGSAKCTVKTGAGCFQGNCTWDYATRTLTFSPPPGTSADISHVEFGFCCSS